MKRAVLLLMLFLPFMLKAQVLKERRVYYLDCSYSMKTNGIWDEVCDNLKKAIDNISDETTELIVVPFAFDRQHHTQLSAICAKADNAGKAMLKKKISAIALSKNTMTYHSDPIVDFYRYRVDPNRVTYMFFMTDGQNEEKPNTAFFNLLRMWGAKFGNQNVFGFYVMLNRAAKNQYLENVIEKQKHLWKVETADVNIRLIRLQNNAIYNARNDKYFDLPIYGSYDGLSFTAKFSPKDPYEVIKTIIVNGKVRVYVRNKKTIFALPNSQTCNVSMSMKGGKQFDFLVTENVKIKCESKPERSLKLSVK